MGDSDMWDECDHTFVYRDANKSQCEDCGMAIPNAHGTMYL